MFNHSPKIMQADGLFSLRHIGSASPVAPIKKGSYGSTLILEVWIFGSVIMICKCTSIILGVEYLGYLGEIDRPDD